MWTVLETSVSEQERRQRERAFALFAAFVREQGWDLEGAGEEQLDMALANFGRPESKRCSANQFKQCIALAQCRRPHWRLPWARAVLRSQEVDVPSQSHLPMPESVMLALFAVAVHWRWDYVAFGVLVSWLAALRPGEACALLSTDLFVDTASCFVVIRRPKTRRKAARVQYVRIWEAAFTRLAEAIADASAGQGGVRLVPYSRETWRSRIAMLLRQLGVPAGRPVGYTPASFRSGRATQMYTFWEAHGLAAGDQTRRLLRHTDLKNTDRYIQEVTSATQRLPADVAARVALCASQANQLTSVWLRRFVHELAHVAPVRVVPVALGDGDSEDSDG
jgi:hypothetical protein